MNSRAREADGRVAVDTFSQQLTSIHRAGLMNAVNMDTGYVNYRSADGRVAVDTFSQQLTSIHRAGLMNAVNMDTGYVNYLSDTEKQEVLSWTREVLGKGIPFVAGAYIEHLAGDDIVSLYRHQIDTIVRFGGIPILFQSARLHGKSPAEIAEAYRA